MVKVRHKYNIIFDLDGTLVHTAPALAKAANYLLRELNLPEISTDVYSSFIGGGIKKQVQRLLNHFEYSYRSIDKYEKRFKDFYYIDPYFQTYLFTGFAFGDSLEVLKPDPLMVKLATKNFSPKKNIYIGDSNTDLKTARNSNSIFILFTEGYRKENISELKPDYFFSNYRNLLELIKKI